jgi:hypothetical protein
MDEWKAFLENFDCARRLEEIERLYAGARALRDGGDIAAYAKELARLEREDRLAFLDTPDDIAEFQKRANRIEKLTNVDTLDNIAAAMQERATAEAAVLQKHKETYPHRLAEKQFALMEQKLGPLPKA